LILSQDQTLMLNSSSTSTLAGFSGTTV